MAHVHMKPEIHYVENHREFVGIKIEKDCVKLYVPAVFREHKNFRLTNLSKKWRFFKSKKIDPTRS